MLSQHWPVSSPQIYYECCNGNVDTTLKARRQIYNVFSTSILRRCTDVVSALQRTSTVDYSMPYGSISIALSHLAFVWYASSIL